MESQESLFGNDASPIQDNWPLWRYVTKLGKTNEGGGNQNFRCNFCNVSYKGTYSRVKSHLLKIRGAGIRGCSKVSHAQINQMFIEEGEAIQRRDGSSRMKMAPLTGSDSHSIQSSSYSMSMVAVDHSSVKQEGRDLKKKRKASGDTAAEEALYLRYWEQLDSEIARMFYSAGLPLNLARNPYFISAFSLAAKNSILGYVPPSYNALRTKLLQKERINTEDQLQNAKNTWGVKGISLLCDGWTDPQRRPVINFIAVNERGPVFLRAVNCQGEYKDKYFIADMIKEVIRELGASNVVQVITDNAPVCKAAGFLIEQAYPTIFWTPCVVHTLNLALKNICAAKNTEVNGVTYFECHWITEIVGSVVMIRDFILNHSMKLDIFDEFPKLKLLVAESRFASVIVMLKRFKQVKQQLLYMVISEKWPCYRVEDVPKARLVKEKLVDDDWWDSMDYILAFTEPIYDMIRVCDTEIPSLHLVYEMWDNMIARVKEVIYKHERKQNCENSSFWDVVHQVLEDRWSKSNTPLHCLAHSLNPRCTTEEWKVEHPRLTPPHRDAEISNMRKACLRRLFPDDDMRRKVSLEFAKFSECFDEFADVKSMKDRWMMEPMQWWLAHGSRAPHLQPVALKLFGQVSSSSCCERNWSTYTFMQSATRSQITTQKAKDLVFVHSNLRLLSRKSPQYMQGDSKMWDVGGDGFEPLDEAGILEIANLSLDEPEFESVAFSV